jgi:SAM-dependent methyltransferase
MTVPNLIADDLSGGLDAAARTRLAQLVRDLRHVVETDLSSQAEGRFGFRPDGTIEADASLTLTATQAADRTELRQVIDHVVTLGETRPAAIARLVREATFTHVNRLLAIRIAEAIGVLPESLARGQSSVGFAEVKELAPLIADDYAGYLRLCGDELAGDAPALFDPRNPVLALAPSSGCLSQAVALLGNNDSVLWTAADTLGWAYQFFNGDDERKAMRDASSAPRTSRELAVRNQFFTPRYVVDFLVQNTLGRRILEADPASPLLDELPLLLDPPTKAGEPLDLIEIRVLDPACGSGHFLLGAYDLLERAWAHRGVSPADAAPQIIASLAGVDIDPRCAQVAAAAIALRARRRSPHGYLPRPLIVCARGLPPGAADLVPTLTGDQRSVLIAVESELRDAPLLGVLLRAEEKIDAALRQLTSGGTHRGMAVLQFDNSTVADREAGLRAAVAAVAEAVAARPIDRLLAAEVDDALRLWEICRTRFHAVLMNPPFGEPVPGTKAYLAATYPTTPGREILCAFVERGLQLCRSDGYLGAITSRGPLFLKSGEDWRTEVVLGNRLTVMADLGFGVMEEALVEAAAYVIGTGRPDPETTATFVRLLRDTNRPKALAEVATANRTGAPDSRLFSVDLADLGLVPGSPFAYWLSPALRELFTRFPQLEGNGADVRQGLATGDDFRFVRTFWEVNPRRIARSAAETRQGKRWVPFAKGGEYSPYWADIHLVVDWEDEGRRLRDFDGAVIRNAEYYFQPGLTWPRRTASGFGVRVLPTGCAFGDKGPVAIAPKEQLGPLLGWLQSRFVQVLIQAWLAAGDETSSGGASKSYEVGLVQKLPWPSFDDDMRDRISRGALGMAGDRARGDADDESTRLFVAPWRTRPPVAIEPLAADLARDRGRWRSTAVSRALAIEAEVAEALDLGEEALGHIDDELGPAPGSYPADVDRSAVSADLCRPIDEVIREALANKGGARAIANLTFVGDRQLEVLSHLHRSHPASIEQVRAEQGLLASDEPETTAHSVLSYLVGAAFGRWDLRTGLNPESALPTADLFGPIPLCPPGMLVGDDGFPAPEAPSGYPIGFPPGWILVDEAGHSSDIETAVHTAAGALWKDHAEQLIADLLQVLGHKSLRDGLRKGFWKDHLSRYSKSRRQAPIYWPLTTKSKGWGLWLYAPALTRETLFAVAAEAARRERLGQDSVGRLAIEASGPGRTAAQIARDLDAERKLTVELADFRIEAERVAAMGWSPDLDDGFVLCAAPLAGLLPQWKEAEVKRKELRSGKYPWATVAGWADRL